MGKIILASSSPRRRDLLKKTNLEFEIIPSPYEENHTRTDFSYDFIKELATGKAKAVIPLVKEPAVIIGADTVVVLDNKILGKPKDKEDAFNTLKLLSGKTHIVVTGIAIINTDTNELKTASSTSYVTFENLTDEQIQQYIDNYKPLDKAGSYGIQEMPDGYIKSYTGSLDNIIGLDVEMVLELLNHLLPFKTLPYCPNKNKCFT